MSGFNGTGTFVVSGSGLPVTTGTVVSSTVKNQWDTDVAAGLTNCLCKDGQSTPTADLTMGGFRLKSLAAPSANGDALSQGAAATVSDLVITGGASGGAISGKNRIINGDFRISSYNGSSQITPTAFTYPIDRFSFSATQANKLICGQNLNGAAAPSACSLVFVSNSAYTALAADVFAIVQIIEANNITDFRFGVAAAATITLSFWVYSSLTGTFCGSLRNAAGNRSYVFTYNVPVANTWTK